MKMNYTVCDSCNKKIENDEGSISIHIVRVDDRGRRSVLKGSNEFDLHLTCAKEIPIIKDLADDPQPIPKKTRRTITPRKTILDDDDDWDDEEDDDEDNGMVTQPFVQTPIRDNY